MFVRTKQAASASLSAVIQSGRALLFALAAMEDDEDEEDEEEGEAGGDEDEEDLYESDVSLAEDMDEQEDEPERGRGGAPAFAASGQDAGAWARARRCADATALR
jgi:hypothetical protein